MKLEFVKHTPQAESHENLHQLIDNLKGGRELPRREE